MSSDHYRKKPEKQSAQSYPRDAQHIRLEKRQENVAKEQQEHYEWQEALIQASKLRRKTQINQAVQIIQELVQNIPINEEERKLFAVTYYLLAETYRQANPPFQFEKIENAYEKSIDLDPDFMAAYRERANFYVQERMPLQAINAYHRYAQKYPQNGEIYTKIGDIYADVGNNQQSTKYRMMGLAKGWKGKVQGNKFSRQDQYNMIIYGP